MKYDIEEIPGWCAGAKLGLTDYEVLQFRPFLPDIIKLVVEQIEASVIVVSVNEKEKYVIDWCKANGFKKGPVVRNWGHAGRKTYMYFYQIKKSDYRTHGGHNWDAQ